MQRDCPYPDCSPQACEPLVGADYWLCSQCGRLALPCSESKCPGLSRPFMRYCRECGEELSNVATGQVGKGAIYSAARREEPQEIADLSRFDTGGGGLDCRLLLASGVLFAQFADRGGIVALHPFKADQSGRFLFALDGPGSAAEVPFPIQVAGSSLIVCTPTRLRRLYLPLLWHHQWQSQSAPTIARVEAEPQLETIHEAEPDWEFAAPPLVLPSSSSDNQGTSLFLLLRQKRARQIQRWTWLRFGRPGKAPEKRNGWLNNVSGENASCIALSDRMVAVATSNGHWLISSQLEGNLDAWEDSTPTCENTLDGRVATGQGDETTWAIIETSIDNGDSVDTYLRWFYVGDPDRLPDKRRLFHYTAKGPQGRVSKPDIATGDPGLCPVGGLITSEFDGYLRKQVLCTTESELFTCDTIGTTNNSGVKLGPVEFRRVAVHDRVVKLIWRSSGLTAESTFGLIEFQEDRARLGVTISILHLRGMPVACGPHILAVRGDGENCRLVSYNRALTRAT